MTGSADNARGKGRGGGEAKDGMSDGVLSYSVLTVCVSGAEQPLLSLGNTNKVLLLIL